MLEKLYFLDIDDASVLSYLNSHSPPAYPDFMENNSVKTMTVDNLARRIKLFKETIVMGCV